MLSNIINFFKSLRVNPVTEPVVEAPYKIESPAVTVAPTTPRARKPRSKKTSQISAEKAKTQLSKAQTKPRTPRKPKPVPQP